MFCPNCGKATDDTAVFCPACGERLPHDLAPGAIKLNSTTGPMSPVAQPDPWVTPRTVAVSTTNYAGFWLRFVAHILDNIVCTVAAYAAAFAFGVVVFVLSGDEITDAAAGTWALILTLVVPWLYFAFMESSSHQATLGKKAAGIIVTDEFGRRVGFARATGRYWAKFLSGLLLFIGFVIAAFTPRKQALHDMIAGTLVLRKPGT